MEEISIDIKKGTFLIASPEIDSGVFFRSVILLCEHTSSASFGLMINKQLDIELPEEILSFSEVANPNVGIRTGGPIQANQMMLLRNSREISQQTLKICEDVFLGGDLNFLQEAMADKNGPYINLCFGYTGWSSNQLQKEFFEGQWIVQEADAKYIFHSLIVLVSSSTLFLCFENLSINFLILFVQYPRQSLIPHD